MQSPFVPVFCLACLMASAACDRPPQSQAAASTWYELAKTPEIRALLDTGRIQRTDSGTSRIWFRFEYATPMPVGDDTARYQATETRQELDCRRRRTRGLELRMEVVGGAAIGVPTPDLNWSAIDTHPLNPGIFIAACRAVGTPMATRGAA